MWDKLIVSFLVLSLIVLVMSVLALACLPACLSPLDVEVGFSLGSLRLDAVLDFLHGASLVVHHLLLPLGLSRHLEFGIQLDRFLSVSLDDAVDELFIDSILGVGGVSFATATNSIHFGAVATGPATNAM